MSNYATKKGYDPATSVDTSDLVAKKDFIASKAEVEKLDVNNVRTSLNNLKTKVDNLAVGKLKTVPADLKNLSDLVKNEVVKNTNVLDATTLTHINQYPTNKKNIEKKIGYVDKKNKNRYKWFRD